MTPEARIAMCFGEEVKIVLVKDSGAKEVKHGERKISQQHKKACGKLLRLNQSEEGGDYSSYMKSADKLITECGGPS